MFSYELLEFPRLAFNGKCFYIYATVSPTVTNCTYLTHDNYCFHAESQKKVAQCSPMQETGDI
jgi:hypothetical protein